LFKLARDVIVIYIQEFKKLYLQFLTVIASRARKHKQIAQTPLFLKSFVEEILTAEK
jgi:hypothetical protein